MEEKFIQFIPNYCLSLSFKFSAVGLLADIINCAKFGFGICDGGDCLRPTVAHYSFFNMKAGRPYSDTKASALQVILQQRPSCKAYENFDMKYALKVLLNGSSEKVKKLKKTLFRLPSCSESFVSVRHSVQFVCWVDVDFILTCHLLMVHPRALTHDPPPWAPTWEVSALRRAVCG